MANTYEQVTDKIALDKDMEMFLLIENDVIIGYAREVEHIRKFMGSIGETREKKLKEENGGEGYAKTLRENVSEDQVEIYVQKLGWWGSSPTLKSTLLIKKINHLAFHQQEVEEVKEEEVKEESDQKEVKSEEPMEDDTEVPIEKKEETN